ncbi:MAG: pullulanase-type alpha-1,6-glucosidase, partial [Candidatus Sericytochromatia bacterium]|nr:pullulanase-type alpha-1,6-glucosidase [Candidatus Sericytochromatia bacterium]
MKKTLLPLFLSILVMSSGCATQMRNQYKKENMDHSYINKQYIENARARWISAETITWQLPFNFNQEKNYSYHLYYSPTGSISIKKGDIIGAKHIELLQDGIITEKDPLYQKYPYLKGHIKISTAKLDKIRFIPELLRGNIVVAIKNSEGKLIDATQIQNYGVLDQLYTYNTELGVDFSRYRQPTLRIWAPTAQSVRLFIYKNPNDTVPEKIRAMDDIPTTGIWEFKGNDSWVNKYYLYEVKVYSPISGNIETNYVTDPYSISLSTNSKKSQIIDFNEDQLKPLGWDSLQKPKLDSFQDISIYELHVRDFSARDKTVINKNKGKFLAFTERNSNGMKHLRSLANAGLTHVHLLPIADMSSVNEEESMRKEPDLSNLSHLSASSSVQQQLISTLKKKDSYNWGYDPFHYSTPEGSYSSNPEGSARIVEFRHAVKSLNDEGLRVIMDVVYNHTSAAGSSADSVLDKVVPGYYYRLDNDGKVQNSTCCPDTASEHNMMGKLIVDSIKIWAKNYKIDGFRFDLMGHHTADNLKKIRHELDSLTLEKDNVDGKKIYLYGEGWKFGSLNDILPDQAMTQQNSSGSGVGTFNDRMRDSVRGGNFSADTLLDQGFINGLFYDYNNETNIQGNVSDRLNQQKNTLLNYMDIIKTGLAGNLKNYQFNASTGLIKGSDVTYNTTQSTGYTLSPQENINYISAHDNHTLWDQITAKAPFNAYQESTGNGKYHTATNNEKVRMQNMGLSLIALGQGIPFFHAGDELLRSKSGDGDSYESGDWFNYLDFSYNTNNWGVGLPPEEKNKEQWKIWQPRLEDSKLKVSRDDILTSYAHFQKLLKIRRDSGLFRLRTANDIMSDVSFLDSENYNKDDKKYSMSQIPGFIAMNISDNQKADKNFKSMLVLFNATNKNVSFTNRSLINKNLKLHPILTEDTNIDADGEIVTIKADP